MITHSIISTARKATTPVDSTREAQAKSSQEAGYPAPQTATNCDLCTSSKAFYLITILFYLKHLKRKRTRSLEPESEDKGQISDDSL
jgi:hypothetical protein